jgi:hypothetical protein
VTSDDEIIKRYSLEGFLRRHRFEAKPLSVSDLERGCRDFEMREPRDSMYRVSTFLVREGWGDPPRLVEALSVLLLVWNSSFYRFGGFGEQKLEDCLRRNESLIGSFRERDISSFSETDHKDVHKLFIALSDALKRANDGVESPVSVGKTLHLLAPKFFPLWDQYIAPAYNCPYQGELPSVAYIAFSQRMRDLIISLTNELGSEQSSRSEWLSSKTLLKRLDEYNYVSYTLPALALQRKKKQITSQADAG